MKVKTLLLSLSLSLGASSVAMADWSGFYVGPQLSYSWMNTSTSAALVGNTQDLVSTHPDGFAVGPHVGWAYQMNQWVLGLEASYSGGSFSDSATVSDGDAYKTKVSHMFGLTPVLGYSQENWLFYGKAGYVSGTVEVENYDDQSTISDSERQYGWLAGAGVSYMLNAHSSLGLEYDYTRLGSTDLHSGAVDVNVNPININTISLNYTHYFG